MIYLVEDDDSIRELVIYTLRSTGMEAKGFGLPSAFWRAMAEETPELVLLDIMLPEEDGLSILKKIKNTSQTKKLPVIMLTAKGEDMDKILGLEYGADDYITKPFNILEVKARIKAILRRNSKASAKTEASSRIETGDMRMDCDSRSLFIHDKEVYLTAKEFDLLELLVLNPNKVYSRETLLNTIWGYDYPGDARTVDVHVRRLREKIEENPSEPKYVHTKWGVGYYLENSKVQGCGCL